MKGFPLSFVAGTGGNVVRILARTFALAFLGMILFCQKGAFASSPPPPGNLGADLSHPPVMPSLELLDLSGRTVRTSALSGHPLLILNFMAPWCDPCLKEIPSLVRLSRTEGKTFAIRGILEGPTGEKSLNEFLRKTNIPFPLLRDPALRFSRALGVHGLPTTFIVDSRGHVVSRVSGAVDWDDPRVRSYLKSFISSKAGF